ncbi:hypothetical protein NOK12_28550 [Nocardioides sp. OK12]|nr:hypothetical protein NOK12_28550 [Nocardioides sp. OK12]
MSVTNVLPRPGSSTTRPGGTCTNGTYVEEVSRCRGCGTRNGMLLRLRFGAPVVLVQHWRMR